MGCVSVAPVGGSPWAGLPKLSKAANRAVEPAMTAADAAGLADSVEKLIKLYTALDRDLPRDTFEPAAVVKEGGNVAEALFNWVRDNTSYVPYRGMLRGAL